MNINEIKYGFKLLKVSNIKDYKATLYEYYHLKSGGHVLYFANDDTNCAAGFGFRTLPNDSTGVCHIIEHSLLCGSEKYPLKEPFVNLLKGSLATFLNAFTANDWTMYPFSSQTPKDFDNILAIYADAVFKPLSMIDKKPFLQEGWHLELLNEDDTPCYKGVVYNEMKGAMSSVDEILSQETLNAIYEGSIYAHNSGGDPDHIIDLTYEDYKAFYKKHYNPSNAMTFFYGKLDIESKLKFLDENYFSNYDKEDEIIIELPKAHIDLNTTKYYGISKDESEKDNTYFSLCYGIDSYANVKDNLALEILVSSLLSSNNSLVKKAILDAGLGQNVEAYLDEDKIIPALHIDLSKSNPNMKEKFKEVFENEIRKLVKNGIDKELLLATINHYEFTQKELNFGSMPKGIAFAMTLMSAFNYHDDYVKHLDIMDILKEFKENLNSNYFENLLEKYILNSRHMVEVTLIPDSTLLLRKEEQMKEKMEALKNSLSIEEKKALVKQTQELLEYQNKEDSKKELATLPKLSKKDIVKEVNYLSSKSSNFYGLKAFKHEVNTNGIGYLRIYFDLNVLNEDDLPYLKLLNRLLINVDTNKYTSIKLKNLIKTYLGNLSFSSMSMKNKDDIRIYELLAVSSLSENINYIPDIVNEIMYHSKFSKNDIITNIKQIIDEIQKEIIGQGNKIAYNMAAATFSKFNALYVKSGTSPITYKFYKDLLANYNHKLVNAKLKSLCKLIFAKDNANVSLSGCNEDINILKENVKKIKLIRGIRNKTLEINLLPKGNNALIIPSGVSYSAYALEGAKLGYLNDGRYEVLAHILTFDYLWKEIRVKGGAYGTSISFTDTNNVAITSYRDPNVKETYAAYNKIYEYLTNFKVSKEQFNTYLIGTMAKFDVPVSTPLLISRWDNNYLLNNTKKEVEKYKKEAINTTIDDIYKLKEIFKDINKNASYYTVGNEAKIKEYNFDNIETL